jgi:hypothetical protein
MRTEGIFHLKFLKAVPGIESGTSCLVAQCLNQLRRHDMALTASKNLILSLLTRNKEEIKYRRIIFQIVYSCAITYSLRIIKDMRDF